MSDLLGIGATAVSAYQTALTAIGENVANAQTPGYTRREIRLREATPQATTSIIYQESLDFGGVRSTGVSRAWDQFRANDARITAAAAGRADARQTWLTNMESALDDSATGVGSSIGKVFTSATNLAANPDDTLGRRSMLMALDDAAGAFRNTASALSRVSQGIAGQAGLEVDSLNNDLAALAKVNVGLRQAGIGTPTAASLQDKRDQLLDSIAGRVDINVTLDAKGQATVTMAGSPTQVLVDPGSASRVTLAVAADGRLSLSLDDQGVLSALPVASGSLAGLIDSAAVTADRRADLDQQAQAFATSINNWSAQGRTADNNPGGPLLNATGGAAGLTLLTSDITDIAAASSDGTANGNLLALGNLRTPTGPEARWAALVSSNALMVSSAKSEASAAATQRDNSFAARDAITGVDLDQEAAELMRFQQAYNGATKIIQVARETMQSILDLF